MPQNDTDYIKDYVAKKTTNLNATTSVDDKKTSVLDAANDKVEDYTADTPDIKEQIRQKRLHREALKADKAAQKEEEAKLEQARAEQLRIEQLEKERRESIAAAASQTLDTTYTGAKSMADKVAAFPTTGGIALLVTILVILLFTIVQVNAQGDTRLKQLWYSLNGRATLQGRVTLQPETPGFGGGGSNFGSVSTPASGGSFSPSSANTLTPLSFPTYRTGLTPI